VVYGLLTASFFSTLAGVHLPGATCLLHGVSATFHHPVYVGDRLTVTGAVAYRNEAFHQAELTCHITNQKGVKVSTARLKVGVRP
jgi:3-hydroxybutyryl-CoA dehydratase